MGMAASQARLLSITARLTNNENTGEAVSYAKQRLADQTQQITNEYNEALDATKLTVLTGFNGAEAIYEDISYNCIAGLRMAESTKQYFVTDTKGRLLVTEEIADAYEKSGGNYNMYLAALGYSQADIYVQYGNDTEPVNEHNLTPTQQKIHEAWDRYFKAVGIDYIIDPEHPEEFSIGFFETYRLNGTAGNEDDYAIGDGYAAYYHETYPYKKDDDGNYLDKNGAVIPKDAYSDGISGTLGSEWQNSTGYWNLGTPAEFLGFDDYKPETNALYEANPEWVLDATTGKWTNSTTGETVDFDKYSDDFETTHPGCTYVDNRWVNADTGEILDYDIYTEDPPEGAVFDYTQEPESKEWIPLNYEGTTKETRDLYDYAMAITEAYLRVDTDDSTGIDNFVKEYVLTDFKSAADSCNNAALKYYRNIFDRIQQRGFVTYTDTAEKARNNSSYIYSTPEPGKKDKVAKNPLKDNYTFEKALRDGTLRLEYYSSTKKQFISTTISEDNCIQEVPDERAIAKAERKYTQDMQVLESQDKKFDLELKKLDTEHKALETEYESVKSVVNKNVESTFKIFS